MTKITAYTAALKSATFAIAVIVVAPIAFAVLMQAAHIVV